MTQDLSLILPQAIIRIMGLSCTQIGFFAYSENTQLRISHDRIASLPEHYDFLVALDPNDVSEYQPLVKKSGIILYNENSIPTLRTHKWFDPSRTYIPIALDSFAKLWGPADTLKPFVALGALAALVGLDTETLFHYLPINTEVLKTAYQDCITAGFGYISGLDKQTTYQLKALSHDSSRLYISGFDAMCLALRKVDATTIATAEHSYNLFGEALKDSCRHYGIGELEGSATLLAPLHLVSALQSAYPHHVLIIHHHDETALFAATSQANSYLASDMGSLYSHIYLAMLKQQVENNGTVIFVADHLLMSYQTLHELPIPSEQMYEPYSVWGSERARICILSTGSSKGVIIETQELLKIAEVSTKYIHFNHSRDTTNWLHANNNQCELVLITTPLTISEIPALTIPNQEIGEWHDAVHLSQIIQKTVQDQNKTP